MNTLISALLTTALTIAAAANASASSSANVLLNPHFDADLSDWMIGSESIAAWTSAEDYHEAGSAGIGAAMVTSTGSPSVLMQCVGIEGGQRYVSSAWAKSTCGRAARLTLFWADNGCNVTSVGGIVQTSSADKWQSLSVVGLAPSGTKFDSTAIVVLENTGDCLDTSYFDDAHLMLDEVFNNGFDPKP